MNHFEHKIVNFIAAVSPWSAPAIPTYFTIHNALTYLLYGTSSDRWFVWILAIALEFVGLAAVHTVLEFWTWNKRHVGNGEQAPVAVAIISAVVYITIVLVVNVALELYPASRYAPIFARGTLSLLSIPAALIVGIRAQHIRRVQEENEQSDFAQNEQKAENELNREIKRMKAESRYRTNEQITEQPNERPRRVRHRTNEQQFQPTNEHRTNGGFNPFPNEHRTNEDNKQARLFEHIQQLQANGLPVPGPSQLSRDLQMSKSYISERLKEWRTS